MAVQKLICGGVITNVRDNPFDELIAHERYPRGYKCDHKRYVPSTFSRINRCGTDLKHALPKVVMQQSQGIQDHEQSRTCISHNRNPHAGDSAGW